MSSQLELTAKAMLYAVIVFMSMTQFGSLSDLCRSFGGCGAIPSSAIAFGVIVTVPALVILVLFLMKNAMASRIDAIAAPVLFVFITIATALSCRISLGLQRGLSVYAFAAIIAFIAVVLLNIYNIMSSTINIKISATDASEKPAVASEPVPSSANV